MKSNIKKTKEEDLQRKCITCGHTYGWHNNLGFCCKCSSFNKPCWKLEKELKIKWKFGKN